MHGTPTSRFTAGLPENTSNPWGKGNSHLNQTIIFRFHLLIFGGVWHRQQDACFLAVRKRTPAQVDMATTTSWRLIGDARFGEDTQQKKKIPGIRHI